MNIPTGLVNLGNTCFLNSCIQVLNQIYEIDSFMEKTLSHKKTNSPDTTILEEWNQLKEFMKKTPEAVSPVRFVYFVQQVARFKNKDIFTGWAQNDLTEFLFFVIDCFHNSVSRGVKIRIHGKKENDTDKLAFDSYSMIKQVYEKEYSEFMDLFYGVYVSQIKSLNGTKTYSRKPEMYFILDLPISNTDKTLIGCLNQFIQEETLDNENAWLNPKTNMREVVNKNIVFWSFPKVLVISLNRFSSDGETKKTDLIDFPIDELDLSPYVVGYSANSYIYELFGVCNHIGGIMGGHYTAFVKDKTNSWFHFNDTHVSPIQNAHSIVTPMAYCLFYRKKNRAL